MCFAPECMPAFPGVEGVLGVLKVFLFGFGNVGREVARILLEGYGRLPLELVGVASSRGVVRIEGPVDRGHLLRLAREGGRLDMHPGFKGDVDSIDAAVVAGSDLAFIALPPSYGSGEPNRMIVYSLLDSGVSLVTADKTVLALDYERVTGLAREKGLFLGYRATVAAGTPVLDAARMLRYRGVERVTAIVNATTNYILGLVEQGHSFEEAVREAIRVKLAEPDPTVDTHGWDSAAKLVITAGDLGYPVGLDRVERVPLESVGEDAVRRALGEGRRVKYVARADFREGVYRVEPMVVDAGSPLAMAEGEDNVAVFELEGSSVVVKGPAGPAWRTARVMVSEALEYAEQRGLRVEYRIPEVLEG